MIEINNLTTNPVDEEFLKKVTKKVLEGESASWRKKESDLSIALVGQGRMRELNKKYRGKNRVTDVLTFAEKPKTKNQKSKLQFIEPLEERQKLGEIVICLREVKKNAKRFGLSLEKELTRVLIHGLLHLLGYNHEESERESKRMKEKEEYYLSQV